MLRFILYRLLTIIPVLWAAATLSFGAIHLLPGDPVMQLLAHSGASPQAIAEQRAAIGWDRPLGAQYAEFLYKLTQGDLGRSWVSARPVVTLISEATLPTLELATVAIIIAITLGAALGIVSALRRGTWLDRTGMFLGVLGISTPIAWTGLLAIMLFSVLLGWLPPTGNDEARHLVLPGLVLGIASAGSIARLMRSSLLDVLVEPFVTVARAKGLPGTVILIRHSLPVAAPPVVAMIAVQAGFLMGGAAVTETLFARQGLGRLMVEAVLTQDLPVVQGLVLISAVIYSLVNLASDLLHWQLDPRVRD